MLGRVLLPGRARRVPPSFAAPFSDVLEGSLVGIEILIPGSMGETSALFCLIGAFILIATGIGSWRTMAAVTLGTAGMAVLLNTVGSSTNPAFGLSFGWHFVLGGWAFGTVFMATDPVSSAFTNKGRWIYGFGIGVMVVLVRVVNPATAVILVPS